MSIPNTNISSLSAFLKNFSFLDILNAASPHIKEDYVKNAILVTLHLTRIADNFDICVAVSEFIKKKTKENFSPLTPQQSQIYDSLSSYYNTHLLHMLGRIVQSRGISFENFLTEMPNSISKNTAELQKLSLKTKELNPSATKKKLDQAIDGIKALGAQVDVVLFNQAMSAEIFRQMTSQYSEDVKSNIELQGSIYNNVHGTQKLMQRLILKIRNQIIIQQRALQDEVRELKDLYSQEKQRQQTLSTPANEEQQFRQFQQFLEFQKAQQQQKEDTNGPLVSATVKTPPTVPIAADTEQIASPVATQTAEKEETSAQPAEPLLASTLESTVTQDAASEAAPVTTPPPTSSIMTSIPVSLSLPASIHIATARSETRTASPVTSDLTTAVVIAMAPARDTALAATTIKASTAPPQTIVSIETSKPGSKEHSTISPAEAETVSESAPSKVLPDLLDEPVLVPRKPEKVDSRSRTPREKETAEMILYPVPEPEQTPSLEKVEFDEAVSRAGNDYIRTMFHQMKDSWMSGVHCDSKESLGVTREVLQKMKEHFLKEGLVVEELDSQLEQVNHRINFLNGGTPIASQESVLNQLRMLRKFQKSSSAKEKDETLRQEAKPLSADEEKSNDGSNGEEREDEDGLSMDETRARHSKSPSFDQEPRMPIEKAKKERFREASDSETLANFRTKDSENRDTRRGKPESEDSSNKSEGNKTGTSLKNANLITRKSSSPARAKPTKPTQTTTTNSGQPASVNNPKRSAGSPTGRIGSSDGDSAPQPKSTPVSRLRSTASPASKLISSDSNRSLQFKSFSNSISKHNSKSDTRETSRPGKRRAKEGDQPHGHKRFKIRNSEPSEFEDIIEISD